MLESEHEKLFEKIDGIHQRLAVIETKTNGNHDYHKLLTSKIEGIGKDMHKLSTDVNILVEKTKQIDDAQRKIGNLEGRMNIAEGQISAVQTQSVRLNSNWDRIIGWCVQLIIIVLGAVIAWKLTNIDLNEHTKSSLENRPTSVARC